ncbi:MAG: FKBP-type peptidyl-prolyl cis-trans isomerase [Solirubrobacteraceae bacterium]
MTNFNISHSIIRSRAGAAAAALAAAILIAGCGSGGSSTITVGNENSADNSLIKAGETATSKTSAKCPSGTPTPCALAATTPTSGPLSKEPTVTVPSGPAPSKLETKDLIVGKGAEAQAGATVTVNYVGVLYKNGKVFDASWLRHEPSTFSLNSVIPGWTKGIPGMRVGGRRELVIPSALAYGAKGSPPTIPPNAPLVFVVDLLGA